jgi:hypothetical protein
VKPQIGVMYHPEETLSADELLRMARSASHNGLHEEASKYWLRLDTLASANVLPSEWRHY